jgi:intein/homing endonuclease
MKVSHGINGLTLPSLPSLAIKEFLIRVKPELETLLVEVPSPPLHKLYGSVLESFGYGRSPKLKEIANGAARRNELLHKPEAKEVTVEDANQYVEDIEVAINHLFLLLYPTDPSVKKFFNIPKST